MRRKEFRARCALGICDEFGNRIDLVPGQEFDAKPANLGGLVLGEHYERNDGTGAPPSNGPVLR